MKKVAIIVIILAAFVGCRAFGLYEYRGYYKADEHTDYLHIVNDTRIGRSSKLEGPYRMGTYTTTQRTMTISWDDGYEDTFPYALMEADYFNFDGDYYRYVRSTL